MRSITLACARPPLLTPSIPLVVGRPRGQSSLSTRSPSSEAYLPVLGTPFHFFNPHPAPNSNPGPSRILPQPPTVTFAPTPSAQRSPHPQTPPPDPEDPNNPRPDQEVSDAEWEIRVARGMLHLRETLPHLFSDIGSDDLFPRDVFSPNVVLKLPVPFPVRIPGITGYRMAFAAGRSGLHALHTDLGATLDRMTFSPPLPPHSLADTFASSPTHRHKQIRVMLSLYGTPRLPPHALAEWTTSNLYTFNPYSGLIACHEVETIRPLPGEGVAEWVMHRLLGWTRRQAAPAAGGVGAVRVEFEEDGRRR